MQFKDDFPMFEVYKHKLRFFFNVLQTFLNHSVYRVLHNTWNKLGEWIQ